MEENNEKRAWTLAYESAQTFDKQGRFVNFYVKEAGRYTVEECDKRKL
jgi:hypothetical protein